MHHLQVRKNYLKLPVQVVHPTINISGISLPCVITLYIATAIIPQPSSNNNNTVITVIIVLYFMYEVCKVSNGVFASDRRCFLSDILFGCGCNKELILSVLDAIQECAY